MQKFLCALALLLSSAALADQAVETARAAFLNGDYASSIPALRPAAEAGNPTAQNILGLAYEKGYHVPQDIDQAIEWYQKSIASGDPKAMHNLGLLLRDGADGLTPDPQQARQYLTQATDLDFAPSFSALGVMFEDMETPDFETAARLYARGDELGDRDSSANLGLFYVRGQGVDQDYLRAKTLFARAAALGSPRGANNLGVIYAGGYGVETDNAVAALLYLQAAQGGYMRGAVNLADLIHTGQAPFGTALDAAAWCIKAVKSGEAEVDEYALTCAPILRDTSNQDLIAARIRAEKL